MTETTASTLTEDQAAYVSGLIELAGWLSQNPDGIPGIRARLLLPLSTNAAVEDFAARHGLSVSYDDEGNASAGLAFGRVVFDAYGYVDFDEHCERTDREAAERFATRHGLALVSADTAGGERP